MKTDYIIYKRLKLTERHRPTGRTRHFRGSEMLPSPRELQIVKYPEDEGFYLFYFGENGDLLTDTYHENVESAFEQANWEFQVNPNEWENVAIN